jgi:hypothetical protein
MKKTKATRNRKERKKKKKEGNLKDQSSLGICPLGTHAQTITLAIWMFEGTREQAVRERQVSFKTLNWYDN